MRIETGYRPRSQQAEIHRRLKRFNVLVCHRRFGKTVLCVNALLDAALKCKKVEPRFAYVAPLLTQGKDIAWSYLKAYALCIPGAQPNEAELRVDLPNGARIRIYGADNPDRLRGIYLDGVVLDEYADMYPRVWSEVIRPALSDRLGWAIFIGTPKGKNDFWRLYDAGRKSPNWFVSTFRASETGIIDPNELADARREMTEDQYEREYECSFEAAITGAVYGRWMADADRAGRIRAVNAEPGAPVCTAWDLGYSDATAIWWFQVLRGEIRILDYYENHGEGVEHYADVIKSRPYTYGKHYGPHDAANKLLAAGGRSIVQQLDALGVRMYVVPATSQQNGIEAARKTLEICWFDEAKCGSGIEALRQYQFEFDDKRKIYRDRPRHDWTSHGADAFEIIGQVWRAPIDQAKPPPPRFLHQATADEVFWPPEPGGRRERI